MYGFIRTCFFSVLLICKRYLYTIQSLSPCHNKICTRCRYKALFSLLCLLHVEMRLFYVPFSYFHTIFNCWSNMVNMVFGHSNGLIILSNKTVYGKLILANWTLPNCRVYTIRLMFDDQRIKQMHSTLFVSSTERYLLIRINIKLLFSLFYFMIYTRIYIHICVVQMMKIIIFSTQIIHARLLHVFSE